MTDDLVEEIKSVIDLELVPYWEERVEPLLKEKDVVLVVHFT
jgi:bisphosphoglycerate-dependent phosphoglycerate mutase